MLAVHFACNAKCGSYAARRARGAVRNRVDSSTHLTADPEGSELTLNRLAYAPDLEFYHNMHGRGAL